MVAIASRESRQPKSPAKRIMRREPLERAQKPITGAERAVAET